MKIKFGQIVLTSADRLILNQKRPCFVLHAKAKSGRMAKLQQLRTPKTKFFPNPVNCGGIAEMTQS